MDNIFLAIYVWIFCLDPKRTIILGLFDRYYSIVLQIFLNFLIAVLYVLSKSTYILYILLRNSLILEVKVIQYNKFRVCTIAWNGIKTSELEASLYTKICS